MSYADSADRLAVISGLRALANYLESNPEIPAPIYPVLHIFPQNDDWSAECAEIDAIAARLTVNAYETSGGHYVAARFFGAIEYRAVAIPRPGTDESE